VWPLDKLCVKPTVRCSFTLVTTMAHLHLSLVEWLCECEKGQKQKQPSEIEICPRRTFSPEWHLICRASSVCYWTNWLIYYACCRCRRDEKRGEATKRILPCKLLHPTIAYIAPTRRLTHPDFRSTKGTSLFFSLSTRNFLPPRSRPHISAVALPETVNFWRKCRWASPRCQISNVFHPPTVRRNPLPVLLYH
jgi:hypothetical protein